MSIACCVAWLAAACESGDDIDRHWGRQAITAEGIELLEPLGDVDLLPDYLAWSTGTAASYAVAILDADGRPLWQTRDLPAPSCPVTAEARALVRPGVEYGWQVLAIEGNGRVRDASPVARFRVRPRD